MTRIILVRPGRFRRLGQEPCAVNRVTARDGEFTLVSLNDTSHLEDPS